MFGAKACHFQRITHAAPGLARQILQRTVHVVVGDKRSIAFVEQGLDPLRSLMLLGLALRWR